ncbi:metallophosphoesterase family protein [Allorhodopirellula heiligendammensis]|uniref:Calcineurin-like phosphoesterase superfamily domain protein n=1 Tax=Allorhodopirellula heiligendammensis TaxID=2714739 RepID=A0A5C6C365_9BACT|nr:metallophosphoesterase [Allorhodopirellula heiligendammensis]TWU18457.1 Calcineurin-like phosphoesterase superfamily domain protein [Allorhodopirellula heiligendammensis]
MTIHDRRLGRRAVLQNGTLFLATAAVMPAVALGAKPADPLKIGVITDLHYADKPAAGTRYYRETLSKLEAAALQFEQDEPRFVVELGDLIDAADSVQTEQRYLSTIDREFSQICKDRHYVLGNHCVETLKKDEFLGGVGQEKSYYSFDRGGYHFIVLDSCFRSDGEPYGRHNSVWTDANVPPAELEWLAADLKACSDPVIVFAHQRLDVSNSHGVRNGAEVRRVLEASGNVLAVFQGHSHRNDVTEIAGIHYCTLVAMVEGSGADNNGYSVISLDSSGAIAVDGFCKQADYRWKS